MSDLTATFLGTSAAVPTVKRNTSGVALRRDGDLFLFDCGEGTQRQMMRFTGAKAPRAIFITHAHGDHWLGLPGLLATLAMQEHHQTVELFLPADTAGKIQRALEGVGIPAFVEVRKMRHGDREEFGGFSVSAYPTSHTPDSMGYVFEEDDRPGRFDPQVAIWAGLEPGPEFKALQDGQIVKGVKPEDVIGPPRRGRKVVITGDTRPCPATVVAARGADLLIHEATFESTEIVRARKTKHSTGNEAGQIAQDAQVERLILTHFSPRSDINLVTRAAAQIFAPTQAAHDGLEAKVALS